MLTLIEFIGNLNKRIQVNSNKYTYEQMSVYVRMSYLNNIHVIHLEYYNRRGVF